VSSMDGADAPLARQDDGGVRGAAAPLDSATVVVDPALPAETRDALLAAGRKLIPYRDPAPSPPPSSRGAHGCMSLVALFFVFAILGTAGGNYVFASLMIMLAASGVPIVLASRPTARDIAALRAPFTEHRRYVLPSSDIDAEHWKLWKRAVDARNRIAGASVVGEGRIDSVHIGEVLPHRLWDIAERLARLAEVRAKQREILGDVSPDDPDVAQAVARQRRAQELALADVARRVSDLEKVAGLVDAADLLARKESVVRELNALDDTHAELLAGIGDTPLEADVTDRLADEATAVMEQARQAIAQANEAALTLAPPDNEPPEGEEPEG
jgi:hypothetical protein